MANKNLGDNNLKSKHNLIKEAIQNAYYEGRWLSLELLLTSKSGNLCESHHWKNLLLLHCGLYSKVLPPFATPLSGNLNEKQVNCKMQAANYKLQAVSNKLQASSYKLETTRY